MDNDEVVGLLTLQAGSLEVMRLVVIQQSVSCGQLSLFVQTNSG